MAHHLLVHEGSSASGLIFNHTRAVLLDTVSAIPIQTDFVMYWDRRLLLRGNEIISHSTMDNPGFLWFTEPMAVSWRATFLTPPHK
jgi:hypothetical protein